MSFGSTSFNVAFVTNIVSMTIAYALFMYMSSTLLNNGSRKRMLILAIPYIVANAAIGTVFYKTGSFHMAAPLGQIFLEYYLMAVLTLCIRSIYGEQWRSCLITAAVMTFLSDAADNFSVIFAYKQFRLSVPADFFVYILITLLATPAILLLFIYILKRMDVRRIYDYWIHNDHLKKYTMIFVMIVPISYYIVSYLANLKAEMHFPINPGASLLLMMLVLMAFIYVSNDAEKASRLAQQDIILRQHALYEQNLEKVQSDMRTFRHDFKNMMAGIYLEAEDGNLDAVQAFIAQMTTGFDKQVGEQIRQTTQLGNILIPELKSLILVKLVEMQQKRIDCRLEVIYPVGSVSMNITDVCRALGILIDNAIEAAENMAKSRDCAYAQGAQGFSEKSSTNYICIVINALEKHVSFMVKNPVREDFDFSSIYRPGFTTKGGKGRKRVDAEHGIGLTSYRRILSAYDNVLTNASVRDGCLIQEFIVNCLR